MSDLTPEEIERLLPCPFCGGGLEIAEHFKGGIWRAIHRCRVVGPITFEWTAHKKSIVEKWNTRPLAERVRELEAENARLVAAFSQKKDGPV